MISVNSGILAWGTPDRQHMGSVVKNAHPHIRSCGSFTIVHNGMIENYESVKKFLIKEGFTFYS